MNFELFWSHNVSEEDDKDISIKASIKHNELFQQSARKCNDGLICSSFSKVIQRGKELSSMILLLLPINVPILISI